MSASHQVMEGLAFRHLRNELRFSQADLARFLGVADETVGRWERGQSPVPYAAEILTRQMVADQRGEPGPIQEIVAQIRVLAA